MKQFSTNVITLVSNTFTQDLINTTLGVMFSGNWGEDNKIFGDDGALKNWLYGDDMNFGNKIMRTLGAASVIYTLGMKLSLIHILVYYTSQKSSCQHLFSKSCKKIPPGLLRLRRDSYSGIIQALAYWRSKIWGAALMSSTAPTTVRRVSGSI